MNPLRTLRVEAGLTQKAVAAELELTTQSVLRYEQALYEVPSTRIMKFLCSLDLPSEPTETSIIEGYVNYQQTQRAYNSDLVLKAYRSFVKIATTSPVGFEDFRAAMAGSRMDFCKKLCIHPAVVADYEEGSSRMPPLVRRVLLECGLEPFQVTYLAECIER